MLPITELKQAEQNKFLSKTHKVLVGEGLVWKKKMSFI
jgi:hypothetical protein